MRLDITESEVKRDIIWFLQLNQIFCWVNHTTGIYDTKQKKFRKLNGLGARTGVSDILGIYKGQPLAIEVKKPGNKATDKQLEFINDFNLNGGLAFVATSVHDVQKVLGL